MSGLITLAAAAADAGVGIINQGASNKTAKYLARLAYDKQLEQWNRANVYNSPAEQMKRLKDAGLSPNLVYNNGTVTGNTTQAGSPKYEPPNIRYDARLNALNVLQAYQDVTLKQRQIDAVQKENTARDLQNRLNEATLQNKIIQSDFERGFLSFKEANEQYSANLKKIQYDTQYEQWIKGNLRRYNDAKVDSMLAQVGLLGKESAKRAEQIKLYSEQAKLAALNADMAGMSKEFFFKNQQLQQKAREQDIEWNSPKNRTIRYTVDTATGMISPVVGAFKSLSGMRQSPNYPSYDYRSPSFNPNNYNNSYLQNQFYTP